MDLIELSDLEVYLKSTISDGNPSYNTADEALYSFLITAMSEYAEAYCGRTFSATDYTTRLDGNGCKDLILPQAPIISLTSATYIDIDENETTIDTDNIVIEYDEGILYKSTVWAKGRHNVNITYSAGYSSIPDGLKSIICSGVVSAKNRIGTTAGIKKETLGDYEYELVDNSSTTTEQLDFNSKLDLYKLGDVQ